MGYYLDITTLTVHAPKRPTPRDTIGTDKNWVPKLPSSINMKFVNVLYRSHLCSIGSTKVVREGQEKMWWENRGPMKRVVIFAHDLK